MEIPLSSYYNKKIKLQKSSFREGSTSTAAPPRRHRLWRIRRTPKLRLKIASPVKFFGKFHNAYVDLMTYVGKKIPNPNSIQGGFLPNVFVTGREISFVSAARASRHLEVDSKLVLEMYENLGASQRIKY